MSKLHPAHAVEVLEARIAPALLFLSGTARAVVDAKGADVNVATAATDVGATVAALLKTGDSLVLDTNGNGALDSGEVVYAKVTGGKALIFAKDGDSTLGFGADEITGVAMGNGAKMTIAGDVHGSVSTVLDPQGNLTKTTLQNASIAGLTVSGRVLGDVTAGKNLSHVSIGAQATGAAVGVSRVLVGTAASGGSLSFDGGATSFSPIFSFAKEAEAGGSISDVTVYKGVDQVLAGGGNVSSTGKGGAGGSISKLKLIDAVAKFDVNGGSGGNSTAANGIGGNGGKISGVTLGFSSDSATPIDKRIGTVRGGNGGTGNSGGAGGDLTRLSADFQVDALHWFYFGGGSGGSGTGGGQKGNGGNGGSATNVTATGTAKLDSVSIYGGSGGNAGVNGNGKGGNGGQVQHVTYSALGGQYPLYVYSGDGGKGGGKGTGGSTGNVDDVTGSMGDTRGSGVVLSGNAGDSPLGKGGSSGKVSRVHLTAGATTNQAAGGGLSLGSGAAGNGGTQGGTTGDVVNCSITATGFTTDGIHVFSATGGNGVIGGKSGKISGVKIQFAGAGADVDVIASNGGQALSGAGGTGGDVSGVTISETSGTYTKIRILGGNGGSSGSGNGQGGNGGTIAKSTFNANGAAGSGFEMVAGNGGNGSGSGKGGLGGKIVSVDLKSSIALTGTALVAGGQGGNSTGAGGKGGASGSVNDVELDLAGSVVFVEGGNAPNPAGSAGGTGSSSAGGAGGSVTGIKGTVGTLIAAAGSGGSAEGKGGAGGSIANIKLTAVSQFVRLVRAGDGGNGAVGGKGGSISNVDVAGDIGDFTSSFGISAGSNTGMGGLISGLGGFSGGLASIANNGAISKVAATRIATILAGAPSPINLSEGNAVPKISGLTRVTAIGADVNGNTVLDFTDNPAGSHPANGIYQLGDNDTLIDGVVIVAKGKLLTTVVPFKLFEV